MTNVGTLTAGLEFLLDDKAADRFERRMRDLRQDARRDITQTLKADDDSQRVTDRFSRSLRELRTSTRRPVEAELRADDSSRREMGRFERALRELRQDTRKPITAKLKADPDTRGFQRYERGLRDVDRGQTDVVRGTTRLRSGLGSLFIGGAGFAGAAAGAYAFVKGARVAIGANTDINESLSKNKVLFGDSAREIERFSDTSAKSFGISKRAALEYTGTFGNLFRALGISREESSKFSVDLTKLAADMASFNNSTPEEALEAIRSGLVGETEPLRRFGVNMNDATLRAEALKQGLIKTDKEALTPQQKALAATALITKQTANAHGDFERTSKGAANQSRIFRARLEDLAASAGAKLAPAWDKALGIGNKFLDVLSGGGKGGPTFLDRAKESVKDFLGGAGIGALRGIGGHLASVGRDIQRFAGQTAGAFRDVFGGEGGSEFRRNAQTVVQALLRVGQVVVSVFRSTIGRVLPGVAQMFRGAFQVIRGVVNVVGALLRGDFAGAFSGASLVIRGVLNGLVGSLRIVSAPIRAILGGIAGLLRGAFSAAFRTASRVAGGALDAVGGAFRSLRTAVVTVVDRVLGLMSSFLRGMADMVRAASKLPLVGGAFKGIADQVDAAARRVDGLRDRIHNLKGKKVGIVAQATLSLGRGLSWAGDAIALRTIAGQKFSASVGTRQSGGREPHMATRPTMVVYGEDAPRHPEYFIPTNPAFRDSARHWAERAVEALGGRVEFFQAGGARGRRTPAKRGARPKPALGDQVLTFLRRPRSGIQGLATQIEEGETKFGQVERQFGISEEVYVDPDTGQVNTAAVNQRVAELDKLIDIKKRLAELVDKLTKRIRQVNEKLRKTVRSLRRALDRVRGKSAASKRRRSLLRGRIGNHEDAIDRNRETLRSWELRRPDFDIDLLELGAERRAVASTAPEAREAPTDTGGGGDVGVGDTGGGEPVTAAPTAEEIAAAGAAQLAAFTAGRQSLFASFGANFMRSGASPIENSPTGLAAGLRAFGALGTTEGSGGGGVKVEMPMSFATVPPDPHAWSQDAKWNLQAALGGIA